MTFTPLKPDAGPSPALDASIIQTNFSQFAAKYAQTVLGIKYNHTALNDTNQGDHEAVIFQRRTTDPTITQPEAILYCKNASSLAGTQPQLFVKIPKFLPTSIDATNAPNNLMQLTYNSVNTAGPVYQSFLIGGYLIYFGSVTATGTVTLTPAPTALLSAVAAVNTQNLIGNQTPFSVSTNITANNTFDIYSSVTGVFSISWMAVGTV